MANPISQQLGTVVTAHRHTSLWYASWCFALKQRPRAGSRSKIIRNPIAIECDVVIDILAAAQSSGLHQSPLDHSVDLRES